MSYHKLKIHKHDVGSPFKIGEEFLEYIDAVSTGNLVMAVQELSDLYGCIENEVAKYGMTVAELKVMSDLTREVFDSGTRESEGLLSYLKRVHSSITSWGLGFIQVKCGNINYNFYHDSLQKFSSSQAPHSHQRDFVSEIIKGEIHEVLWDVKDGESPAYCGCGNLFVEDRMLDYSLGKSFVHKQGDLYLRTSEDFHTVSAKHGTVSKVVKYGSRTNAFVIAPREVEVIKAIPEDEAWKIVEEVLNVQY